ncbi:hypothetical protein E2C01_090933 [Portunus trituberculatus]|uniref:Uncharacterized protein n=1 Tax=Portunus trituberculatus TaxID=210409 RepID=A0A5B7JLM4_PORTR|nr:hypothetical protein [Portunus trituberculatus]
MLIEAPAPASSTGPTKIYCLVSCKKPGACCADSGPRHVPSLSTSSNNEGIQLSWCLISPENVGGREGNIPRLSCGRRLWKKGE